MGKRSNGEGTIFKRSDGRWCAAYFDKEYRRHYVYGKTQKEIKQKLKKKMSEVNVSTKGKGITVDEWMVQYLDEYKRNEVKETTYWSYMELYEKHIKKSDIGLSELQSLTSQQLQKFYNDKKEQDYNPKTIRHMYVLINSALDKAMQIKLLNENVNRQTVIPKKEAYTAKVLSAEEVKKILVNAKEDKLYPIIALEIYTGLRKGEIMALKWENISFDQEELHVEGNLCRVVKEINADGSKCYEYKIMEPKTAKSKRVVPLLPGAIEALKMQQAMQAQDKEMYSEIYNDQGLVFARCDGTFPSQRAFMDKYHAFLKRYGASDVRFHDLRHTFATLLLEAGEEPKAIQELLGHSTYSTTMDIYAHVTKKGKVNAIKRLDILVG